MIFSLFWVSWTGPEDWKKKMTEEDYWKELHRSDLALLNTYYRFKMILPASPKFYWNVRNKLENGLRGLKN